MRNVAIMLLSAFFFSCEDPINIAVDTPSTGGQFSTTFTDSLTVSRVTVMLDSILTSTQTGAIVGHYKDPVFGDVSATLYTQISLPFNSDNSSYAAFAVTSADSIKTVVYDSMYVYLVHNGFSYGDSTKPVTLNIHRLTEDFVKGKNYLNRDALAYNQTPLVSKVFTYKDFKRATVNTTDSLIRFKMPDALGNEIFSWVNKPEGRDIDKFTAAVKGFAFTFNQNAETVHGITLSLASYPAIYYHVKDDTIKKYIPLTFLAERFSEIKSNRQGTALQNLKLLESLPAELTGNKSYIQTGVGITTKINFPTLNNLLRAGSNVAINKAELIIEPDLDQITGSYKPPLQIALVEIGKDNRLKKVAGNIEEFVALDVASGTQYISNYSTTTNNYKFNFTSYIQELLNKRKTSDGIAIVPSLLTETSSGTTIGLYNNNVSRVVIKNIKLNLYYSGKR